MEMDGDRFGERVDALRAGRRDDDYRQSTDAVMWVGSALCSRSLIERLRSD
jgi:hypothetical protein